MKKILGIIGSPRQLGNCEIMIKEIARNIPEPSELLLLRLSDFNIQSCRGCYNCLSENAQCVLKDDFEKVLDALCIADAIILAAPTYFLGANAILKRVLDRSFRLYSRIDDLWGTPSVGICIAGIEGKEGHGLLGVENFLKFTMTDMKLTRVVYGALPGEVFLCAEKRKTAVALAHALFSPARQTDSYRCPVCGGDTFRFLDGTHIRCMLCSNSGMIDLSSGSPAMVIQKSKQDLFLTKEEALKHREWLRGMKTRFLSMKSDLKSVSVKYREDGKWITPSSSD
jgi:multimeric flavodoxin WrbA